MILRAWWPWAAERGVFQASNEFYAKAIKQDQAKRDREKREVILVDMGLNFLDLRNAKLAVRAFETCLQEFPTSLKYARALVELSTLLHSERS